MRWMAVAAMGCVITAAAWAGEEAKTPTTLSPEEAREGFVSIFDGKTLKGWRGTVKGYAAEDGMLVCKAKGGGNLFTEREFGDMIFRFEFRLPPGGNNGVSIRGHEIQILDDYAEKHKHLKPCQYHGSIYCKVPAKRGATKPAGEWNSEEIKVKGTQWTVTVNGKVVVDCDISKVPGLEGVARRKKGPIGFRGHGCRVEFRNLRVKEL